MSEKINTNLVHCHHVQNGSAEDMKCCPFERMWLVNAANYLSNNNCLTVHRVLHIVDFYLDIFCLSDDNCFFAEL
jgi:hypothetical protein